MTLFKRWINRSWDAKWPGSGFTATVGVWVVTVHGGFCLQNQPSSEEHQALPLTSSPYHLPHLISSFLVQSSDQNIKYWWGSGRKQGCVIWEGKDSGDSEKTIVLLSRDIIQPGLADLPIFKMMSEIITDIGGEISYTYMISPSVLVKAMNSRVSAF